MTGTDPVITGESSEEKSREIGASRTERVWPVTAKEQAAVLQFESARGDKRGGTAAEANKQPSSS